MNATSSGFSISMRTTISYREAVESLREALAHHGFEILFEFPLDRELENKAGLTWKQLGLPWKHYTVLLVWSPLDACPALLTDRDGGLLVPFNLCVAERDGTTFISAINHNGALKAGNVSLGAQALARDQSQKIRNVFSELVPQNGVAHAV